MTFYPKPITQSIETSKNFDDAHMHIVFLFDSFQQTPLFLQRYCDYLIHSAQKKINHTEFDTKKFN